MLLLCSRIIAHMWPPPFCFGRSNAVFMLLLCSCIIAHTVGAAIHDLVISAVIGQCESSDQFQPIRVLCSPFCFALCDIT